MLQSDRTCSEHSSPTNACEHTTMLLRKTGVQSLQGKQNIHRGSAVILDETSVTLQKFRGNLILTYSSILRYSTNVRMG